MEHKNLKREIPAWQYDEMKLCGVKFDSEEFADKYDEHHQRFRDYKKEAQERILLLGLGRQAAIIDMGCGTGAFAIHAASYFRKIYAVDVSNAMIEHARKKAKTGGFGNIEFHHGGFLTYEHKSEPVDGIVSALALHHLPDFWKFVALQRMAQMLRPGGRLLLFDVVFSFDTYYEANIKRFIQAMADRMGDEMKHELETHIRQEYSTFDWIMEEMLKKAGFKIKKTEYKEGFFANYLCEKKEE
jgi:putative AdoMet-dependent methyltransferase